MAKKFAVFINPRLTTFNSPFVLAFVIFFLSVVSFGTYFTYLLGQCSKQSFTTTTRSEMQEWFEEGDSFDPMNNFNANWKCIYYTAKLMASDGDLVPDMSIASSFMNDYADNCAATGRCEHRYTYKRTPGSVRYNKCDIGTVRYTKKSRSGFYQWLVDVEKRVFNSDPDLGMDESRRITREAEQEVVGNLKGMLSREDGAAPVNLHGYTDVAWVSAHDVHLVPGAFDEVMLMLERLNLDAGDDASRKVSKDHPVWLYLQSEPYTRFDGTLVESENKHKFEEMGGMRTRLAESEVAVLLQSPDIRLRGKGGGQFPGICGERWDYGPWRDRARQSEVWYGADRRRSAPGLPGREDCLYGPNWRFNLSQSVIGFEFKLKNKETVQTAYDDKEILNLLPHSDRVQYIKDSRLLKRSMFCDPADYDEFILYRAQPGEQHCQADKPDEPECTLVRKCDLSGMTSATMPGFTEAAAQGEPASQPEYGSFLVVYEACPRLIETAGVALGFIGQIELFITFLTMGCCLCCGCVSVRGEEQSGSFVQRVSRKLQLSVDTAMESEVVDDDGAKPTTRE